MAGKRRAWPAKTIFWLTWRSLKLTTPLRKKPDPDPLGRPSSRAASRFTLRRTRPSPPSNTPSAPFAR